MTRELLQQLEATPRVLAHLALEATEQQLDRAVGTDWSARTILAHFRDEESLVMRMRAARILAEDRPHFPVFAKETWFESRSTARDRKELLLGDFALQRRASINLLQWVRPEEWERTGHHEEWGEFTLRWWLTHWVEHDREHIGQLERALGDTLQDALARRARPEDYLGGGDRL